MKVLVVDIGGTSIKLWTTGHRDPLKIPSGPTLTPARMTRLVLAATDGWDYSAVSIGFPGPVVKGRPALAPKHLGRGWVGFDFRRAFGRPVRVINDAAMQALGNYKSGRMLFLGLGTGLGTAFIIDGVVAPLELAHLPYSKGRTYEECVSKAELDIIGTKKWRKRVIEMATVLRQAFQVDDVVLGGGNAKFLDVLPPGFRSSTNRRALAGGQRLWKQA